MAATGLPTLSQLLAWDTEHLTAAAARWDGTADRWESAFAEVQQQIGGSGWTGQAADAANERASSDMTKVVNASGALREGARVARQGASDESAAISGLRYAVEDAQNAGFDAHDDYSVTSRETGGTAAQQAARQAQAETFATGIQSQAVKLVGLDQQIGANITSAVGHVGNLSFDEPTTGGNPRDGIRLVDNTTSGSDHDGPMAPGPLQAGQWPDPADPFMDDPRFGQWENVPPPPPYVGSPPPLQPQYRPYPDDSALKVGPTTGMYTPGKTWIGDTDPPAAQAQEGYRFKLAGQQATTVTRTVYENGHWQQQRWVQNVYQYQRNTSLVFGGDVGMKGIEGEQGDIGGLPPIQNIDHTWKPISLPQIAKLSAGNMGTTYYLPDGCGGTVNFVGGVPTGSTGLAPRIPGMTAPR
jgi:hypothetical protein